MKTSSKVAIWGLVGAGACYLLDCAMGNSSLTEMYNLLAHSAPNGNPIGSTISLAVDNAYRLSLPGALAAGAGVTGVGAGLVSLVTNEEPEKATA